MISWAVSDLHLFKFKHYLILFGEAGFLAWVASINWQSVAGTIVILGTTLVGGFLTIRQMLRADRKKYEIENKDSLMAQVDTLNQRVQTYIEAEKKHADEIRMWTRTVTSLRKQNGEMVEQMGDLSKLLMEANRQNAETMRELQRHQQLLRDAGHATVNQMASATGVVQDVASRIEGAAGGMKEDIEKNRLAIVKVAETINVPVKPPLPEGSPDAT